MTTANHAKTLRLARRLSQVMSKLALAMCGVALCERFAVAQGGQNSRAVLPAPTSAPPARPAPPLAAGDAPTVPRQASTAPLSVRALGVDVLPGLGTSTVDGTQTERRVSLNVLAGIAGGLDGFELGGILNLETSYVRGVQIAGVANVVAGPVTGVQVGLVNVAGSVSGVQFGLVNVSNGRVHGAAFGLVNLSEDSDWSVGLVNILRNGHTSLATWVTDVGLTMVGVKHGGRRIHNIYGYGIRPGFGGPRWAWVFGVGVRVLVAEHADVDIDGMSYGLQAADFSLYSNFGMIQQLRAVLRFGAWPSPSLFVGPTLSASVLRGRDSGSDLSLYGSLRLTPVGSSSPAVRMWPGLTIGAEVF